MKNEWRELCARCEAEPNRRFTLTVAGQPLRFCSAECFRTWCDAARSMRAA